MIKKAPLKSNVTLTPQQRQKLLKNIEITKNALAFAEKLKKEIQMSVNENK